MKKIAIFIVSLIVLMCTHIYAQVDHINFNAPILYSVEPAPGYITGADFNRDDKVDLLVTSILWGGGDLLISNDNGYTKESNLQDAEATVADVGDFNNDGWIDYAIATNQGVRVCMNNETNSWTVLTFLDDIEPMTLVAVDYDHDNLVEIAVAGVNLTNNSQNLYIIEYDNDQMKLKESTYALTPDSALNYLRCMDIGDFNNDGYEDIVASFTEEKKVSILLNDGGGNFDEPILQSIGYEPWMIRTADFNDDTIDDLALCSNIDTLIAIYLSDGNGIFQFKQNIKIYAEIYSINVADLNNDGNIDLFSNTLDNLFYLWQNDGTASFSLLTSGDIGAYDVGYGLLSFRSYVNFFPADFNDDGLIDIAGIFDGNQVGILHNNELGFPISQVLKSPGFWQEDLSIVDFNLDNWKDIVGFNSADWKVRVAFNRGNGQFDEFQAAELQPADVIQETGYYSTGRSYDSYNIYDLDNDGDIDFSFLYNRGREDDFVSIVRRENDAYIQTENLHFNHELIYQKDSPPFAVADINNDQVPDLIFIIHLYTGDLFSPTPAANLYIYLGSGSANFDSSQTIAIPISGDYETISGIYLEDFNQDGFTEIILNSQSYIHVLKCDNYYHFSHVGQWEHPYDSFWQKPIEAKEAVVGDYNLDGYPDIALASSRQGVSFLFSDPIETFVPYISTTYWKDAGDIFALDIDNDNKLDIGIVNDNSSWQGNSVSLLRNEGKGQFLDRCMLTYAIGDRPTFGEASDFNNDGLPDILVQYDWNHVKVLINNSEPAPPTSVNLPGDPEQVNNDYEIKLYPCYPNPFNPTTTIIYELPVQRKVQLKIYDILGEEIQMLINEEKPAGKYEFKFDGSNLSSGIYFYRLSAGKFTKTRKLLLLK